MRVWKDIKGHEGKYQVSNDGFTRSLPDIDHRGRFMQGSVLCTVLSEKGYVKVVLPTKTYKMHRLVASAFIPNPDSLPQVNHIDGNKRNNKVENLEWVSSSDNHKHRYRVLGHASAMLGKTGINCPNSKPVRGVPVDGGAPLLFGSAAEAQRATGFFSSAIGLCARGKLRSYKRYQWEYVSREYYTENVTQ